MRASRAKVAALHDTATTSGTFEAGKLARLRLGALARRIEHDRVEALQLLRHERAAEQIARLGLDRLEARRLGGLAQRRDRARVAVSGEHAGALGEPQRERSDAAEQVGDRLRVADMLADEPRQHRLAFGRRLQEGARRQHDRAPCPMRTVGATRCTISSPWRVSRASRCVSARRASALVRCGGSGPEPRTSTSSPASVAVTWMSSGFFSAPSASAIAHAAGSAPASDGASTGHWSIETMWCAR